MLVFYSGWGYWQFDSIESYEGVDRNEEKCIRTQAASPFIKVCALFTLPKDAEKEITYQNETTVNHLMEYSHSEGDGSELINPETNPISDFRFILCHEREGEQKFSIDDRPIIEKTVVYTKDDIKKSPELDTAPKKLNETERNTMLKLIIGMAIDAYGYEPDKSRNDLTGNNKNSLSAKMQTHGITISDDTIRKYLNEAKELI